MGKTSRPFCRLPWVRKTDLGDHVSELVAYDRLVKEGLSKCLPLLGPLETLLNHQAAPWISGGNLSSPSSKAIGVEMGEGEAGAQGT